MSLGFDQLQQMLRGEGIQFFISPDLPMARFGAAGTFGRYEIIVRLEEEGRFLQFRTVSYLFCPQTHPHLAPIFRCLLAIDYSTRLVKFAWDANDGEIVAYADMWVMDNGVTQEQFRRILQNFMPVIDTAHHRLEEVLATGTDPGERKAVEAMAGGSGPAGGPIGPPPADALQELLRRLQAQEEAKQGSKSEPGPSPEPIREI